MNLLYEFQFTTATLILLFILPFSYYGYATKYWYLPERVSLLNFINICLSLAVALFCSIRMYHGIKNGQHAELQLIIAHLCLAVLSLLIVSKSNIHRQPFGPKASNKPSSDSNFKPTPLNAEVEKLSWDDLIIDEELQHELNSVITLLKDPASAKEYGIAVPRGILLQGPPGTGKTTLAKVIANTAGLSFFALRANEIVSKWVGESEKNLTALFDAAKKNKPAVIFIDEIDTLGKARSDSSASHTDSLLNHLLQLMDGVVGAEGIYIIGATNRADLVDEALKRPGRLNRVIQIPLPNFEARKKLLALYLQKLTLANDVDIDILAKVTEGNSAADIMGICNQAGLNAYKRESGLNKKQRVHLVTAEDLEEALSHFVIDDDDDFDQEKKTDSAPQPLNTKIEKLSWDDLIVDDSLKEELNSVITLLKDPDTAKRYGIEIPKGILLQGPPGTGKTTLAKVIANTANLAFFALQTDEVVSKWVGDSEKNLSKLFKAAAKHAPAVIFIDEIDSIGKARDESNAAHADNLLNHLLQLIDGVVKREGLYIIGATNRAELVDPALKRAGRLNKTIEVPLPNQKAREALFKMFLAKLNLAEYPDTLELAQQTPNMSAAEIRGICNQAGLNAFKRESATGSKDYTVMPGDLKAALSEFTNMKR